MAVRRRGACAVLTSARRTGRPAGAPARPRADAAAGAGVRSSTSVFQASQPGQRPCQRALEWPQAEQTWTVTGRAIG
jgi:hypothetical protein